MVNRKLFRPTLTEVKEPFPVRSAFKPVRTQGTAAQEARSA